MITQFEGESRRDAIINHYGLDIESEDSFFSFLEQMDCPLNAEFKAIQMVYEIWFRLMQYTEYKNNQLKES